MSQVAIAVFLKYRLTGVKKYRGYPWSPNLYHDRDDQLYTAVVAIAVQLV